ncbi:Carboxyl-terminal-processing protease [Hordeum vulgare]|nr:Carboxyl-terminal-processing protease [Hordeum vulgare]
MGVRSRERPKNTSSVGGYPTGARSGESHAIWSKVAGEGGRRWGGSRSAVAAATTITTITVAVATTRRGRSMRCGLRGIKAAIVGPIALTTVAAARVGGARGTTAVDRERRGAFLGRALGHGLLSESDPREDDVEGECLVSQHDTDGVETLVEAMEELRGEVDLRDGVINVGEAIREEFHAAGILRNGKVILFEIAILAVEDHETRGVIGEEVVLDLLPDGEGGGGTNDMIYHGVGEGGVEP